MSSGELLERGPAVVLGLRTGIEVTAADLFINVDAVDALMRKEIRREARRHVECDVVAVIRAK